ncbi:MAG TPA: DUF4340 domain-containing protein [Thermoguttaceae bacterium]|nr:DUF4340 domain-containing protein [Thermoguttaceae bacterium]
MNEITKTAIFVAVALAVGLIAHFTGPASPTDEPINLEGQLLFSDFKAEDFEKVAGLEIVQAEKSDADLWETNRIRLVQTGDQWTIASHDDYATGEKAKDRRIEVVNSLTGLKILRTAYAPGLVAAEGEKSDADSDGGDQQNLDQREIFNLYGVIDPVDEVRSMDEGVGTRVTMEDANGNKLVSLILGKKLKSQPESQSRDPFSQDGQPADQYYVRKVGEDKVFTVAVDTGRLSAKFSDWIEQKFLDLTTFDVTQLRIVDQTAGERLVPGPLGSVMSDFFRERKNQFVLDYADSKWSLVEEHQFDETAGRWLPKALSDQEEPNSNKLDDLKYELGDLKIVDVKLKPADLAEQLKTDPQIDQVPSESAQESLERRGFYLVQRTDAEGRPVLDAQRMPLPELAPARGSLQVSLKDGLVYWLRFGKPAGAAEEEKKGDAAEGAEGSPDAASATDEESDELNDNRYLLVTVTFDQDLIPVPDYEPLPPEEEPPAEGETGEGETEGETTEGEQPGEEASTEEKTDGSSDEGTTDEAGPNDETSTDADSDDGTEEKKKSREEIETENQKLREEHQEKITKGQEKAKELNDRFADWYYVISNEAFEKIHLGREQIVKEKEKEEAESNGEDATSIDGRAHDDALNLPSDEPASTLDEFRELKEAGPDGP